MKRDKPNANAIFGQAGVYRVAAEIMKRGFNVHFPAVDLGTDLIIEGRIRVQVKSARLVRPKNYKTDTYHFSLHGLKEVSKGRWRQKSRHFSDANDLVILWGSDDDRFWILPASILDGKSSLVLTSQSYNRWIETDVEAMREARKSGMTYPQIGEKFGIDSQVVWARLTKHSEPKHKNSYEVRKYESRWDLIDSYLSTLREAETAASESTKSPMRETAAVAVTTAKEATHA